MDAAKREERYQAFIKNSSEGIWLVELDKPISTKLAPAEQIRLMFKHAYMAEANEAMAAMYGVKSPTQLIGIRLPELLIPDDPQNIAYLTAFIESGYNLSGVESHEKDLEGKDKYFRNSLVGIVEGGHVIRAWGTQHDITDQHAVTSALKESQERLALALKVSRTGIWEWTVETNELVWSDELKALFGLKPTDEVTYEKYMNLVYSADRDRLQKIIKKSMANGSDYKIEHRIQWPDGSVHWALSHGKAFQENGKVVRMLGTCTSIEDTKRKNELEEINHKLSVQQDQLIALNQSKDEFISLASHQLRTPATGVKQYLGLLLEGYAGELTAEQINLLHTAYAGNERQLTIINDLLRVAQLDAGKIKLNKISTDLLALLQAVIDEQADKFKQKQQTITVRYPKTPVNAHVDPRRMRMVLENLIDNAHKYTPKEKKITVKVSASFKGAAIHITDEGIGISEADMPRLFQKFSRLDNTLTNNVDGTGLGLYWAKKIITLHDGTLTIRSTPKMGSTFTVTVPKD